MAAPCHLVRSVTSKLLVCSTLLKENPRTGQNLSLGKVISSCFTPSVLWKHSGVANTAEAPKPRTKPELAASASEAEKTPVVIDNELITKLLNNMEENMPVPDMANPYEKEHKRCILCIHNMDVNYKNVRLLSQFVSPYTGRIYGRAVTGLCIPMQKRVATAIKQSRTAGYMPFMFKQSEYLKDPRLFDPFKPAKSS